MVGSIKDIHLAGLDYTYLNIIQYISTSLTDWVEEGIRCQLKEQS